MRILVGGVVQQTPEILRLHLESLATLQHPDVQVDFAFVDDNTDAASTQMLHDANPVWITESDPKPEDAEYAVSEAAHHWNVPTFRWLGAQKQRLMDVAERERYDAILLVDSDLVLGADTLRSLLSTNKDIVSGVFWTSWSPGAPALPQTWLGQPYELQGLGMEAHEYLTRLASRKLTRVVGLGAVTLIRRQVLSRVNYGRVLNDLPQGGMWQGEDRHFCIDATRQHIELWADPWPDIFHLYRPSYLESVEIVWPEPKETPEIGDLVSVVIEPLEEPRLADFRRCLRGRLGTLPLLPELEYALLDMKVGDSQILSAYFPMFYEHAPYRGRVKKFQLTLVGAKEFSLPPHLGDYVSPVEVGLRVPEPFFVNDDT